LSEKTLLKREMTCPLREISQSELPLRAHKDPYPATRFDGSGTSTASPPGVGVGVEVTEAETDAGGLVVPVGEALVEDPVVHAASRNAIEQK
jgi:hypothetical protein